MIKRLILLGALALACGAGIRLSSNPVANSAVTPSRAAVAPQVEIGEGRPRWETVWTGPAPGLAQASVAADGSSVAWMDSRGCVRRVDSVTGRTLWQTEPIVGTTRIQAIPGGDVLAYTPLNRLRPSVRVLDRALGSKKGAVYPLDGAVWSVAVAAGGSAAFVGTGAGNIYTLPIRRKPEDTFLRPTVWPAEGIPQSLTAARDGSLTLVSHWGMSGIGAWHPTKPTLLTMASVPSPPIWLTPRTQSARDVSLSMSDNGLTAVSLAREGKPGQGTTARVDIIDAATGNRLWKIDLDAFGARVKVSSDGQFIAVTSAHMSNYSTGSVLEHRLSYYTRDGRRVFGDRGGLYFAPELVAVSADGGLITVQSGPSTLFTLDRRGSFKSKLTLAKNARTNVSPTIRECIATSDGRFLLVVRGDGQMTFYKAVTS